MSRFQIGTSEPHGCIGSRAAQSPHLDEALEECRVYSRARHVKEAWLRSVDNGRMSDVLATFVNGQQQ